MVMKKASRHQGIKASRFSLVNLLIVILLHLSVVICQLSVAQELPRFYGEEVVVTALRVPRLKSTVPWPTVVIMQEEIKNS